MKPKILIIEDDLSLAAALQKVLVAENYDVHLATRGDEGLSLVQTQPFDLVLTDLRLPGLDGLELVARFHQLRPKLPVILMTAHGTTDIAIEATKLGAYDYLIKPFEAENLLLLIEEAVARMRLMSEPVALGDAPNSSAAIVGNSRPMQEIYKQIGRIAATPLTVLIRGETGTGKELVARAIYQHSDRANQPFVAINCAAIPETLLESELFGHERGAFTGAHARRIGRFEQAHRGTLFLDEIGDLPLNTQAKLLRVLQERCFQRLGGDDWIHVDVRVLAATNRDLQAAIQEKEFREDLFYRLSGVTIHLPPLRDRRQDIPDLVRFFIRKFAAELKTDPPAIEPAALDWLTAQPWPGNVRELENVIRRAIVMARPLPIGLAHVQQASAAAHPAPSRLKQAHAEYISELLARAQRGELENVFDQLIADLEPELYSQAIKLAQGNQAKAARWLGVTRLKMREKLTALGLRSEPDSTKESDPQTQDPGKS